MKKLTTLLLCYLLTVNSATHTMMVITGETCKPSQEFINSQNEFKNKQAASTKPQLDTATTLAPKTKQEKITQKDRKRPDSITIAMQQNKKLNPQLFKVEQQDPELYNDIYKCAKVTTGLTIGSAFIVPPATHLFLLLSCAYMGYCPELSSIPFLSYDKTAVIAAFFWAIITPIFMKKKNNPLKKMYKHSTDTKHFH